MPEVVVQKKDPAARFMHGKRQIVCHSTLSFSRIGRRHHDYLLLAIFQFMAQHGCKTDIRTAVFFCVTAFPAAFARLPAFLSGRAFHGKNSVQVCGILALILRLQSRNSTQKFHAAVLQASLIPYSGMLYPVYRTYDTDDGKSPSQSNQRIKRLPSPAAVHFSLPRLIHDIDCPNVQQFQHHAGKHTHERVQKSLRLMRILPGKRDDQSRGPINLRSLDACPQGSNHAFGFFAGNTALFRHLVQHQIRSRQELHIGRQIPGYGEIRCPRRGIFVLVQTGRRLCRHNHGRRCDIRNRPGGRKHKSKDAANHRKQYGRNTQLPNCLNDIREGYLNFICIV